MNGTRVPINAPVVITVGGSGEGDEGVGVHRRLGAFSATITVPALQSGDTTVGAAAAPVIGSAALAVRRGIPADVGFDALLRSRTFQFLSIYEPDRGRYFSYVPRLGGNPLTSIEPNTIISITVT